jgi:hypothetical protein
MRGPTPEISSARHVFFPVLGWAWVHLFSWFGIGVDPLVSVQALNAICGGIAIGFYYMVLRSLTIDHVSSLLCSLLLALSSAYNTHATDMTEVMPSYFLTMLSFLFILKGIQTSSYFYSVLSAIPLSLATGIHAGAILNFLFVLGLILFSPTLSSRKIRFAHTAAFVIAVAISLPLVFILTYYFDGHGNVMQIISYIAGEPKRVASAVAGFGGTFMNSANLFAFPDAIFGLQHFRGLRLLFSNIQSWVWWWNLGILLCAALFVLGFLFLLRKRLHPRSSKHWLWLPAALWFFPNALLAYAVEPLHSKLWVHTMGGFYFLIAIALMLVRKSGKWDSLIRLWIVSFLATVFAANLFGHLLPRKLVPSPYVRDAENMAAFLTVKDLLVSESFDPVSVYFSSIFARPENFFSLLVTAMDAEFDNEILRKRLDTEIDRTLSSDGDVYFLALFDEVPEANALGVRKGMDYSVVNPYKSKATRIHLIQSLSEDYGYPVWLWGLNP